MKLPALPRPSLATALAGFVLAAPSLLFASLALLRAELGIGPFDQLERWLATPGHQALFNRLGPVVFLGGLLAALVLNAGVVERLELRGGGESLSAALTVRRRIVNLIVVALSLGLLTLLVGHAVAENLPCWLGLKAHC